MDMSINIFGTGIAILRKSKKTEKQTHFAVTKGDETTYKEFFVPFWALRTKLCSKIVETLRDLYLLKIQTNSPPNHT